MNKELDGIRALLRDSVFVGILGLGLLFAGLVGAVSWNSWLTPLRPAKAFMESDEQYNHRVEDYMARVSERGQNAAVPFVWAIPMTVTGLGGAFVCFLAIVVRNDP